MGEIEVSVVLPCRNERNTIDICIKKIKNVFNENNINGEIIVSDSSNDGSDEIAKSLGAKVIKHNKKGYGNAYLEGFKYINGKYIIMGDADNTYDFFEIPKFLRYLKNNYDFVIGSRNKGIIKKNSMSFLNRYIGNPLLTFIFSIFFNYELSDIHSGFRGFSKEALNKLRLKTTGMEFASEILIKAIKLKLKIKEIPVTYYQRKGESKLNPFKDGWRHLRLILLYSPNYLFLIPGIFLFIIGFTLILLLLKGPFIINNLSLHIHPMILGSLMTILGYQIIFLGIYAKTYAVTHLSERDNIIDLLNKYLNLEKGSLIGIIILFIGIFYSFKIIYSWKQTNFGSLSEIRTGIFALTLIVIGTQTIFSSFLLSYLGLEKDEK